MRIVNSIVLILLIFCINGCRKDFSTIQSKGVLEFSKDTIFLDTVFTNIGSSTRSFKVYNTSSDAINIPTISLGRGQDSFYRLNVDGRDGKSFADVAILPKDSIYIFVEATINFEEVTNPLYTDSIVFDGARNFQDVDLVTLVQDAHFLFPNRNDVTRIKETILLGMDSDGNKDTITGRLLKDNELIWTNDKPYVIYDFVGVPENKTLIIEAGAQVFFHSNSGLLVQPDATLIVNGTLAEKVTFEGDRLEPTFSDVAGQWGTIWLRAGSKNNEIDYAIIKNSIIGLLVDDKNGLEPTLSIKNTELYNFSNVGILGRATNIKGENLVIANSGLSLLACTGGGIYEFTHSTFANYWRNSFFRNFPAISISNYLTTLDANNNEIVIPSDLEQAQFTNCIVDGNLSVEFGLNKIDDAMFNFNFKNNLLKFDTNDASLLNNPLYDFTDVNFYENNIINGLPDYKNTEINDLRIGQNSDAIGNADINAAITIPFDILAISRITIPDIGAYQHSIFDEEN